MEIKEIISREEARMDKTIESLKHEFANVRTGRAHTSLLDSVMVDYYGAPTPVNQVANVSAPDPRMILIAPWDKTMIGAIEKAILTSDLGLNPNNDGEAIRLAIPQLTEERRKELAKQVGKEAEGAKVSVRNIRRDAIEHLKKAEKNKEITEDDLRGYEKDIQKLTDDSVKNIDHLAQVKEKELLEV